jgi:hypothetical protein
VAIMRSAYGRRQIWQDDFRVSRIWNGILGRLLVL